MDRSQSEILRALQSERSNLGTALADLLDQRFAYEIFIDDILHPALRKTKSLAAAERMAEQRIRAMYSRAGRLGARAGQESKARKKQHLNAYLQQEWKNLQHQGIPERDRCNKIHERMVEDQRAGKDYPRSVPPMKIRAIAVDTIRRLVLRLGLRNGK